MDLMDGRGVLSQMGKELIKVSSQCECVLIQQAGKNGSLFVSNKQRERN